MKGSSKPNLYIDQNHIWSLAIPDPRLVSKLCRHQHAQASVIRTHPGWCARARAWSRGASSKHQACKRTRQLVLHHCFWGTPKRLYGVRKSINIISINIIEIIYLVQFKCIYINLTKAIILFGSLVIPWSTEVMQWKPNFKSLGTNLRTRTTCRSNCSGWKRLNPECKRHWSWG